MFFLFFTTWSYVLQSTYTEVQARVPSSRLCCSQWDLFSSSSYTSVPSTCASPHDPLFHRHNTLVSSSSPLLIFHHQFMQKFLLFPFLPMNSLFTINLRKSSFFFCFSQWIYFSPLIQAKVLSLSVSPNKFVFHHQHIQQFLLSLFTKMKSFFTSNISCYGSFSFSWNKFVFHHHLRQQFLLFFFLSQFLLWLLHKMNGLFTTHLHHSSLFLFKQMHKDVPLMELTRLILTRMPGNCYSRWFGSLLLCLLLYGLYRMSAINSLCLLISQNKFIFCRELALHYTSL